jgi:hypothetical protein
MRMESSFALVKLVFHHVKSFKMEQRAAMTICVKLKRTTTETFEILESVYG